MRQSNRSLLKFLLYFHVFYRRLKFIMYKFSLALFPVSFIWIFLSNYICFNSFIDMYFCYMTVNLTSLDFGETCVVHFFLLYLLYYKIFGLVYVVLHVSTSSISVSTSLRKTGHYRYQYIINDPSTIIRNIDVLNSQIINRHNTIYQFFEWHL